MPYVIGADVGSQSVKGVLLDPGGATCASASAPLTMTSPRPGWAEQNPADWWAALAGVVRQLVTVGGIDAREVTALSLACQVDGVVPVDADGRPLAPAIIWLDRRAEEQTAGLLKRISAERLFAITGLMPDSSHTAPKILWLRENQPEVFVSAVAFPPASGHLGQLLTGRLTIDHANASSSLLYDVTARAWSDELLAIADLSPEQLGTIHEATEVVGTLTDRAAQHLGLTTDCRVLVGTGDDHGGSVGAGVIAPGPIADVTGTAEPVAVCADTAVFDADGLVETHAHAVPGRYLVENPGFVSGGSTLWLAEQILKVPQRDVLEMAGQAPAGCDGVRFVPALSGSMAPRWNGRMRGAFAGLSMAHGRESLARAVLEGCGFALRDIVDRFAALGLGGGEIRVVGGGGRSRTWMQIKADATGRPVRAVEVGEATALGAAMLAAVAAGTFGDLTEAVGHCVRVAAEPYLPDPGTASVYQDAYAEYRALFDGVEGALA
jgi:xylulokinase